VTAHIPYSVDALIFVMISRLFLALGVLLILRSPFPQILLRTSIPPLPRGKSVALYLIVLSESITLIKVLPSAALLILVLCGPIEVIEHEVHVFPLFPLEMVLNCLIPVYLDLYVCVSLP